MAEVDVKERVISGARKSQMGQYACLFMLKPQHRTSSEDDDALETVESDADRTIQLLLGSCE